ncbi:MAG: hypothetical protein LBJ42_00865, partial [Holosporales bacterium]|nr:hypothetical protein [Holosporales bacterium]
MQYKWRILCLTAVTISGYVDTEAARGARQPAKAASGSLGRFVQDGVTTQEDPSGKQAETLLARLKAKGAHDRGKAQYAPKPISAIHSSEPAFRPYPEIAKAPTVRGNKTTTEWIDAGIDAVKFTRPGGTRTDAAYVTARKKQMLTLAPEHSRRQTLLASACSDGLETRSAWLVGKSGVDDRRYPPIDGIRSAAVSQAPQQAATNSQFTIPVYNGASPQFTALETLERAGATTPALMRDARTHPIWAIITGGREFSAKDKQRYIAQEKPDLMTTPLATGLLDESVLSVALGEDMNRTIRKCIRTEYGALPGTTIVSIRVAMAEAYRIFTETVRQKVTRTIERNSPMNMYDALRQTASRRGDAVPLALSDDLSDGQDPRARAREVYNSARLNDDGDIMPLPWS